MAPNDGGEIAAQDLTGLTPGQTYLVCAWVKSSSAANNGVQLQLFDPQTNSNVSYASLTPGTSWQQISHVYTADSAGALRINLIQAAGSTTSYWDDVTLTPVPVNGGFENGSLGPWYYYIASQGSVTVGNTGHSGAYGLTLAPNDSTEIAAQDLIGLAPGQSYLVSAWVKSSSAANNGVQLILFDPQTNSNFSYTTVAPGTSWQQISQVYTADSAGALRINLAQIGGSTTSYWDDVTLTPVPINGSFETGVLGPWYSYVPGTGSVTVGGIAHSGTQGLTLAPNSSNETAAQDITGLTPGQTYMVPAWVMESSATNNGVQLHLFDPQTNVDHVYTNFLPGTSWQQISQVYTADSGGGLRINLIKNADSSTSYWDDVTLTPVPVNGGFESGSLGPWWTWTPSGQPDNGVAVTAAAAHSGANGLTINPTGGEQYIVAQIIEGLTPGQIYQVSAWVRAPSSTTESVGLGAADPGGVYLGTSIQLATYWQQVSQTLPARPDGTLQIDLVMLPNSPVASYWDDVTVVPVPVNGGFESGSLGPWSIWTPSGQPDNGVGIVAAAARTGTHGLRINPSAGEELIVAQDIEGLTPGETYMVSAWIRAAAPTNVSAGVGVSDPSGASYVGNAVALTTSWQQVNQSYTVGADGILQIYLGAPANCAVAIYYDDVTVTAGPADAGFETGSLNPWGIWTPSGQPDGGAYLTSAAARSGNLGLLINPTGNEQLIVQQDIAGLTPGQTYVVSAWVRAASSTAESVVIAASEPSGASFIGTVVNVSTSWQQVSQDYTVGQDGMLQIDLIMSANNPVATYWDDVTVTPLGSGPGGYGSGGGTTSAGLSPGTPAKEYIFLNGKPVVIERGAP